MNKVKRILLPVLAGIAILLCNGLINLFLMSPLPYVGEDINRLRFHLDDAGFVLLFWVFSFLFAAMFFVLPKEKGYLYLSAFSFTSGLQLLSEWDEKVMLFGPIPSAAYQSLAVKAGLTYIAFALLHRLMPKSRGPLLRGLLGVVALLFAAAVLFTAAGADESIGLLLNRLLYIVIFIGIGVHLFVFLQLLREKELNREMRTMAGGFMLFFALLLPDFAKDVMEDRLGRSIGYQPIFWQQALEDTFPWAFLVLILLFGTLFLKRFIRTLRDNREEMETRKALDGLLTKLTKAYRSADLQQILLREGANYFTPHAFRLIVRDPRTEQASALGGEVPAGLLERIKDVSASSYVRVADHTAVVYPAGRLHEQELYAALVTFHGALQLEEGERFSFMLFAKYAAIFAEHLSLLERRLLELDDNRRQPWASKLFLQIAEKERKRLASDLHDEVLQEILHLRRLLEHSPALDEVRMGLENTEWMIRETCTELMPSFLLEHGVLQAVSHLVEKTRLRADFRLEYQTLPIAGHIEEERQLALYRIVQELLHNAMKHSRAAVVRLKTGQEGQKLFVRYEDDGVGLQVNPEERSAAGEQLGLQGIRERVKMLDGDVELQSGPGKGLRLTCSIPCS
ncbi:ATP-binding protein [Paenibacillus turpanensis]|uniref:ATP-binding protein n=1 Tax=Paenibacillus turpanensis TaxID=2689078 RepID=UPI00140C4DF5|nr:ATP-binding protein [Paenibacillus turpanensis]